MRPQDHGGPHGDEDADEPRDDLGLRPAHRPPRAVVPRVGGHHHGQRVVRGADRRDLDPLVLGGRRALVELRARERGRGGGGVERARGRGMTDVAVVAGGGGHD